MSTQPGEHPADERVERRDERYGTGTTVRFVGLALVLTLIVVVLAQNTERTKVELLLWELNGPRFVVLIGALLIGALGGELASVAWRRHRRKRRDRD